MRIFSFISSSVRKRFVDNFNRGDQSGVGTASDGSTWKTIKGSFNIVSNKGEGQTPSDYPLITVDMPKETVSINLSGVTQGATAALWVTDSGNWYGVGIDQISEDCNCQTCQNDSNCSSFFYQCNATGYPCNAGNYPCAAWSRVCNANSYFCDVVGNRFCSSYNARNCKSWSRPCTAMSGYMCVGWSTNCSGWNSGNCRAYNSGNCNSTNSMTVCNAYSSPCNATNWSCTSWSTVCNSSSNPCGAYNAITYYSCNCQTCYPQYIRFIQSAATVVTTLTSWLVTSVIGSFKVIISAVNSDKTSATATIKPYSDTNLSTQIGSDLTYTPTGVTINAQYGIMIKPSSYSQGTTIDEISIETT